MTVNVILSDLFQASYDALDGGIKNRVMDFLMKLQRAPDTPGLDLKHPRGALDRRVRTARVTDNFRAVLLELPDSAGFVLAAVKPHDDAYTFASHVRFGVNEVTGALELIDTLALAEATAVAVAAPAPPGAAPILARLRERDLSRLGIHSTVAADLLRISDEDRLLDVAGKLPRAQADAVLDLAAGRSVEEVWADLVGEEPAADDGAGAEGGAGDVLAALGRPLSRLSFSNPSSEAEMRAVLEGSFEKWRVWLHPLQRRIAYRDGYGGPFRLTGGAGTGKTVTALHRAVHLAGAYPDDKVLVTTFTRTLAQSIKENLVKLAGPAILQKVDVLTVDGLARRVLTAADADREKIRRAAVLGDADQKVRDLWEQAAAGPKGAWPVDFLAAEWSAVVLAQGITDRAAYLKAPRAGRGRRLSRLDRAGLWQVFERFALLLDAHGTMTFTQIASRAAQVPASALAYRHAVVDEAQDLHPAHWRMLRHVVPAGPDDLFLVGDAHQRIYAHKVTLSALGVETRGRSRRLTVNYRTSREILRWCLGVVAGHPVDDLDNGPDTLAGARSEFTGPQPRTAGFPRRDDELAALAAAVRAWIDGGVAPGEIGVVARTRHLVELAEKTLRDAGIEVLMLASDSPDDAARPGVRLATMHRVKGLEFRAVAMIGFEEGVLPLPTAQVDDDEERDRRLAQERCLAYVAGSRAREHLLVTWAGTPSPFLPLPT